MLVHVADGWVARNFEQLKLQESDEMKEDRAYLATLTEELRGEGFEVQAVLAMGEPATEIIKLERTEPVDLIAMTTHGRSGMARFLFGSVAATVVRKAQLPVLLTRPDILHHTRPLKRILVTVEGSETPQIASPSVSPKS